MFSVNGDEIPQTSQDLVPYSFKIFSMHLFAKSCETNFTQHSISQPGQLSSSGKWRSLFAALTGSNSRLRLRNTIAASSWMQRKAKGKLHAYIGKEGGRRRRLIYGTKPSTESRHGSATITKVNEGSVLHKLCVKMFSDFNELLNWTIT